MKKTTDALLVLTTAPDLRTARRLAKAALETRLAACVNLVRDIESHYWWQGRLERSREVLMVFKSTSALASELEKVILAKHPYDTPEFVALRPTGASERYLAWWMAETAQGKS